MLVVDHAGGPVAERRDGALQRLRRLLMRGVAYGTHDDALHLVAHRAESGWIARAHVEVDPGLRRYAGEMLTTMHARDSDHAERTGGVGQTGDRRNTGAGRMHRVGREGVGPAMTTDAGEGDAPPT